jgi:hypothetical protein
MAIIATRVDLAKNVFAVHGVYVGEGRRSDRVDALKKHRRPTVAVAREPFIGPPLAFAKISAKSSINSGNALSARPRQSRIRVTGRHQRRSGS